MFVSCGRCPNYENCNPSIPCEDNLLRFFESEASVLPKKVEEEENAMELVAKIKLADGDNRLIYELNKELGTRAPSAD